MVPHYVDLEWKEGAEDTQQWVLWTGSFISLIPLGQNPVTKSQPTHKKAGNMHPPHSQEEPKGFDE
jgi:hypothetical protein